MGDHDKELAVEIKGLIVDPSSRVPIVILRSEDSQQILPIWIGSFEAAAIARQLQGDPPERPMTHDLLHDHLEAMGGHVERVVICDLKGTTFFAAIHLRRESDRDLILDARPSDAIALALRGNAPLFVNESVLEKAQASDEQSLEEDEERLKKWLEELDPEDLGKYTM